MRIESCDVLVLGGGPGGYVAAIRAGQHGLNTILVERDALGGTCLNVGCIPSKALIHVAETFEQSVHASMNKVPGIHHAAPELDLAEAVGWKNNIVERLVGGVGGLLKEANVTVMQGTGRMRDGKTCLVDTGDGEITIRAKFVVLAPGSEAIELADLPFGEHVINSTEALDLQSPPESLVVVGGGYIGLELGTAFAKMGSKVTVVEATNQLLPQYDSDLSSLVSKGLNALGADIRLETVAQGMSTDGTKLIVRSSDEEEEIAAEKVLVAVGRRARLQGWGLSELSLTLDGNFIRIDEQCRTSMTDVFAIGDVTGEPMLAHRAMAQGEVVADVIAGKRRVFDPAAIPNICFTDPEIVSVGLSPQQASEMGIDCLIGKFPFAANGRAMTLNDTRGFARVVARKDNQLVLGVQAVGKAVSELSASFTLALEMGACLEDIAATIHAHPTLSETVPEAAMIAQGRGLHMARS